MAPGQSHEIETLDELIDQLKHAGGDPEQVSIGDMVERIGHRSFGPLLLAAALPLLTPLAGVPAVPTILSVVILLTAGQLLLRRRHIWIPGVIARRHVQRARVEKAADFLKPSARIIDRILKPRLCFVTRAPFIYAIAAACCLIALTMPPLEFVPLTSSIPAVPVAVFGVALVAHDGLLGLAGFVVLIAIGILGLLFLGGVF